MRILLFHGVGGDDYPVQVFEAQLKFLKKHLSIIPLESLVRKLANGSGSPRNDIALTFDDGLRNHYTIVYPILKQLDMPATFFVSPGLIDSGRWLWNQEARVRLRLLRKDERTAVCQELGARRGNVESIVAWMKTLAPAARKSALEVIRGMTADFKPSAEDQEQYGMMTWDELSSMDPALVSIGSHTVSHPILTTLTPPELSYEVRESRGWLEERLQRPIKHFCYPNGDYNGAVLHCVRQCYGVAVTSQKGDVRLGDDLHCLRRIPVVGQLPSLAWRLHQPSGVKGTYARVWSKSA
jgi:peptidoglycan/xylan/chitin deacetylase (PgdA/CDA1 family)